MVTIMFVRSKLKKQTLPANDAANTFVSMTREEQRVFYSAAQDAAREGDRELAEYYRAIGIPAYSIGRAVGMSGNRDYARFLLAQKPQSQQLATNLAIGFNIKGDRDFVKELIDSYGANSSVLKQHFTPVPPVVHRLNKQRSVCSRRGVPEQVHSVTEEEQSKPPVYCLRYGTEAFFRPPNSKTSFSIQSGVMAPALPTVEKENYCRSTFFAPTPSVSPKQDLHVSFKEGHSYFLD